MSLGQERGDWRRDGTNSLPDHPGLSGTVPEVCIGWNISDVYK